MSAAVKLRMDYRADELRRLAVQGAGASRSRRLLSLVAVLDGMSRGDAARMGGEWTDSFCETGCIEALML